MAPLSSVAVATAWATTWSDTSTLLPPVTWAGPPSSSSQDHKDWHHREPAFLALFLHFLLMRRAELEHRGRRVVAPLQGRAHSLLALPDQTLVIVAHQHAKDGDEHQGDHEHIGENKFFAQALDHGSSTSKK